MISCTEFIWVYSELFRFIEKKGGEEALIRFWQDLAHNFLQNLRAYVEEEGLQGMHRYWSHTLGEEGGRHTLTLDNVSFVIDMHECPSAKLIFQGGRVEPYPKYCDHCRWLYPPLLEELGYEARMEVFDCEQGRCRLTVRARNASPEC